MTRRIMSDDGIGTKVDAADELVIPWSVKGMNKVL